MRYFLTSRFCCRASKPSLNSLPQRLAWKPPIPSTPAQRHALACAPILLMQFFDRRPNATSPGLWSTAGCHMLRKAGPRTVCTCDHFTEFRAIDMIPIPNLVGAEDMLGVWNVTRTGVALWGLLCPFYAIALGMCMYGRRLDRTRRARFLCTYMYMLPGAATLPSFSGSRREAYLSNRRRSSIVDYDADIDPFLDMSCRGPTRPFQRILAAPLLVGVTRGGRGFAHHMEEPTVRQTSRHIILYRFFHEHVWSSSLAYPVTSHVRYFARVHGLLASVLTSTLLMALWFEITHSNHWGVRTVQIAFIIVFNSLVMALAKQAITLPFFFCRGNWRCVLSSASATHRPCNFRCLCRWSHEGLGFGAAL